MADMRSRRLTFVGALVTACVVLVLAAPQAFAAFGIATLDGAVSDQSGNAFRQAGGHPYSATVSFELNSFRTPDGLIGPEGGALKDVRADLPPGLIGNPTALPKCPRTMRIPSLTEGIDPSIEANTFCPANTIVGLAIVTVTGQGTQLLPAPVFNLEPPPGMPAQFAFTYLDQDLYLDTEVRSEGDYGITVRARNLNQAVSFIGSSVTLWGVPADRSHDSQRCIAFLLEVTVQPTPTCDDLGGIFPRLGPSSATVPPAAFLTNPTSCPKPGEGLLTTLFATSWIPDSAPVSKSFVSHFPPGLPLPVDQWGPPQGPTDCEQLPFDPSLEVRPDTTTPDSPTGLSVDLTFPQDSITDPMGVATAHLKRATVTLPEGMTVSPSSADGLKSCSDDQLGVATRAQPQCPEASKIGTVEAWTPLLEEPLSGSILVGSQKGDDPESGDLFRVFLVLENPAKGILIKLPGAVRANAQTGRLETTFDNNPQVPVSRIKLRFKSGDRAPLATPPTCGSQTVTSTLSSWGGQVVSRPASFSINCPGVAGFSPSLRAVMANPLGGEFSPFTVRIERPDRQQYLGGVKIDTPPGLIAKLRGVPLCADAQAAAGTCPAASRIGTATVGAGPGAHPFFIEGPVFLTGPYRGAPYGLAVAVRAVAGPFDLGTVVVRQSIFVDPTDAHLTVVSDPLPTIVKGVPLRLRTVNVAVDRPNFTLNPTSCRVKQVRGTLVSTAGATFDGAQALQANDCRSLRFSPKLAFRLTGKGQTRDGDHPGLRTVLTQPNGQANTRALEVRLPLSLALDPDNAVSDTLCSFEESQKADPKCPASSIVGRAKAFTPVLNRPLEGPVYFARNVRIDPRTKRPRRTLPSLVMALRGEVALNVRAGSDVKRDRLVTTIPAVPDAPVTRFELTLKGGKKGILVISGRSICRGAQRATTLFDAHNGERADRRVRMKTPC